MLQSISPMFDTKKFSLLANERIRFVYAGRSFSLLSLTGVAEIKVMLKSMKKTETYVPLQAGINLEFLLSDSNNPTDFYFTEIELWNDSVNPASGEFIFSNGRINDTRLTINSRILNDNSSSTIETALLATATDVISIILASDANRKNVTLVNYSAHTVWIGDVNVDATTRRGYPLAPFGEKTLSTKAEINAICAVGETADIAILSEVYP